ncbi:MAG: MBL fold metallo-hydrolase [Leptospiraceae bacterium]|nr:MBL fold metallo-hydrolase [Leptospiraceae bacterium]
MNIKPKFLLAIICLNLFCKSLDPSASTIVSSSKVVKIDTGIANLYLVPSTKTGKWILIDNGDDADEKDLIPRLKKLGVSPENILVNIITHGHADHGGNSKFLQTKYNIPIMAGLGDKSMHESGKNPDVLNSRGLFAILVSWFIEPKFPTFTADIYVKDPLSLESYGIEGKVVPVSSHTPGSLVVLLETKEAFVGDLIRGSLGNTHSATEHFFMDDFDKAHVELLKLVNDGYLVFYPGHWGPLDANGIKKVAKNE